MKQNETKTKTGRLQKDQGAARSEPDARLPRVPPGHRAPLHHADAGPGDPRGGGAGRRRGGREAREGALTAAEAQDNDPARGLRRRAQGADRGRGAGREGRVRGGGPGPAQGRV